MSEVKEKSLSDCLRSFLLGEHNPFDVEMIEQFCKKDRPNYKIVLYKVIYTDKELTQSQLTVEVKNKTTTVFSDTESGAINFGGYSDKPFRYLCKTVIQSKDILFTNREIYSMLGDKGFSTQRRNFIVSFKGIMSVCERI